MATVLCMALLILVTGYFAGALSAPVTLASPLIPLSACLLISARAGMAWAIVTSSVLMAFATAGAAGWPVPQSPLDADGLLTMRAVILTLTCLLATAAVWRYERIQAQLRSLALHDSLTGIANRGSFDLQLQHEAQRAGRSNKPLSLLLIDVDEFKAFNDHYGHQAGDACLQDIARSLASRMRRASDFLARYGGEEFVVLLPETTLAEAAAFAELLRKRVADLKIENAGIPSALITISIGVASLSDFRHSSPSQLLAAADIALYQAKEKGRNTVVVQQTDNAASTNALGSHKISLAG